MKMKFFILNLLLALLAGSAIAGNAVVPIVDGSLNPLVGVQCNVVMESLPQPTTAGVAVRTRSTFTTDTNGQFIITNCVPGLVFVQPVGNTFTPFEFSMPVTNGTVNAQNVLWYGAPPNLSSNYPTFAQVYQLFGPGFVGTGFTGIITNLAPLTLATNYNCTITGSGGSFIFGTGPTISVSSNYIVSGSVIVDGAFIWNGTQWVNSSVSPNATLGQSTGFWVFFKPSVGNPSISSSVGAYTSPPDTIQTWNNGGWIANGGVLPWSALIVTNISHVNITSFTNGVCSTNIFQ